MDLGPLIELIEALEEKGLGVTIMPVYKGQRMSGIGSQHFYEFDGWEVGYMSPNGGGEIAVGSTLAEAVTEALTDARRAEE